MTCLQIKSWQADFNSIVFVRLKIWKKKNWLTEARLQVGAFRFLYAVWWIRLDPRLLLTGTGTLRWLRITAGIDRQDPETEVTQQLEGPRRTACILFSNIGNLHVIRAWEGPRLSNSYVSTFFEVGSCYGCSPRSLFESSVWIGMFNWSRR